MRAARDEKRLNRLTIGVSDSGRGIAAEDLPHVFEKFYRGGAPSADEAADTPGIGLGLYLARVMVERMNSSPAVESRVGAGRTFTVRLRICNGVGDESAAIKQEAAEAQTI